MLLKKSICIIEEPPNNLPAGRQGWEDCGGLCVFNLSEFLP